MRVLVTDSVAINTGDAAILMGLLALLRAALPDMETRIHCHFYDVVRARYPQLPIHRALPESSRIHPPRYFWRWPAALRYRIAAGCGDGYRKLLAPFVATRDERPGIEDYRWADLVVSCGGSFLTDTYHFDHVLAGYELGLALGKTMIVLGQTLGPFAHADNLARVGRVLRRFELVVVRDPRSVDVAKEMDIAPERRVLAADMALNLESGSDVPHHVASTRPRIGVSVRRWMFPGAADAECENARYLDRIAETLDILVDERDAEIVFVSTCQGERVYAYRDEEVADAVRSRMRHPERATVDAAFHTPQAFMDTVRGLDVLLGTRMHACILAMIAGVPCVNVEYEFKSRELFQRLGLEEFVVSIGDFEAQPLASKVCTLLDHRSSTLHRIADGIEELRRQNAAAACRVAASAR